MAFDGLDAQCCHIVVLYRRQQQLTSSTLPKAEVEALDNTNKSIATQYGILVFDGYGGAVTASISIDYTYR